MSPDPERSAAEDTVVVDADEHAARDQGWPVSDLYRVEPEEGLSDLAADETGVLVHEETLASPRRRVPPLGIALLAILLVGGMVLLAAALLAWRGGGEPPRGAANDAPATTPTTPTKTTPTPTSIAMPGLEGMTVADARERLSDLGLRAEVRMRASDKVRGIVLRQDPVEGSRADPGARVTLLVSSGSTSESASTAEVPAVVGRSASDAVAALRKAGFEPRIRVVTSTKRAGVVVGQSPGGGVTAERGATVRLDVARARTRVLAPRIEVPDLVGLDATTARQRLAALGLTVEVVRESSSEPAGSVLRQSPRAGARLAEKGRVTLTVSSGPETIDVVDVTGLDEASARAQLEDAGFEVRVTYEPTSDPAEDGTVLRQMPSAGNSAPAGSIVTIVVAQHG